MIGPATSFTSEYAPERKAWVGRCSETRYEWVSDTALEALEGIKWLEHTRPSVK